jgi:ketosteroid isomerase-like protein
MLAPGFHIDNIVTAISEKTYRGASGAREWFEDTFDGIEEARFQLEQVIADGDDFVVGRTTLSGVGARSGARLSLAWISVVWLADGKVARTTGYGNRHEALKAVGLEE